MDEKGPFGSGLAEDFEIGDPKHALRTDMSIEESWKNLKEALNLQC